MASSADMEVEALEEAPGAPEAPEEVPEPSAPEPPGDAAAASSSAAPVEPEAPKRKTRKKKRVTTDDTTPSEQPARTKRSNQHTATPPSIQVDQNFYMALLATQKARGREAKTQRYQSFRIFS